MIFIFDTHGLVLFHFGRGDLMNSTNNIGNVCSLLSAIIVLKYYINPRPYHSIIYRMVVKYTASSSTARGSHVVIFRCALTMPTKCLVPLNYHLFRLKKVYITFCLPFSSVPHPSMYP